MAKILNPAMLQRRIPSGRKALAPSYVPGAGQKAMAVSGLLEDQAERMTREDLAKADADMQIALTSKAAQFKGDTDYATIEERYSTEMSERAGEIASGISYGPAREEFMQAYGPKMNAAREKIKVLAFGKEKEYELGQTIERGEALSNSAIEDGDLGGAAVRFDQLINSNIERNYMTEDDAAPLRLKFKNDIAVRHIKSLAPEARLYALKNNKSVKENMPPDVYAELLRDAEEDSTLGVAQEFTNDVIYGKELSKEDARSTAYKKYNKNPKMLKAVNSQLDYEYSKRDVADAEEQTELDQTWYDKIASGDITLDVLRKSDDWSKMSGPLQRTMYSAAASSTKAVKTPFSSIHHDQMAVYYAAAKRGLTVNYNGEEVDAGVAMRQYYLENKASMSDGQIRKWSDASIQGVLGPEEETGLSDQQAIAAILPATGDAEKRRVMLGEMGEWRSNFISRFNKEPTDKDRQDQIDRSLLEYDAGFWYSAKPVREMEKVERLRVLERMRMEDNETWNLAAAYFADKGIMPTQSEIMQQFIEMGGEYE